jgi:hypothetical protein
MVAVLAAVLGAVVAGLVISNDNARTGRRDVYAQFLRAVYDRCAEMDQQAASRLAGKHADLGTSEVIARDLRTVFLVGPDLVYQDARRVYGLLVEMDSRLGQDQTFPVGRVAEWEQLVRERDEARQAFVERAQPQSRSLWDVVTAHLPHRHTNLDEDEQAS